MKCWDSTFSTQGLRVIIVVVQVEAVTIYVATNGGAQEKEKREWIQFITKIGGKTSLGPSYFVL